MDRELADKKIAEILGAFGIPMAGAVWRVQGTAVIYHRTLEDIARQLKITFEAPQFLRSERDEAVIVVTGKITVGDVTRFEWSIGEALINVNYRVSGKQAAYVYAMAEKRGKDRVILKLIDLDGLVYSEEDVKEVNEEKPAEVKGIKGEARDLTREAADRICDAIAEFNSVSGLETYMNSDDTRADMSKFPAQIKEDVRAFAIDRLKALGWTPPKKAAPKGGGIRR